jgi:crossover junction endodeoxyribonuclease RuvC
MDGERKRIDITDCPLVGGEYSFAAMASLLRGFSPGETLITMESVHALPTDGRCSAFSFGVGYGAWLALIGSCSIPRNLVTPQTWKRTMLAGIVNDKQAEARALKQRFQGHEICSQLHGPRGGLRDGRVDALFLAEYGRVTWKLSGGRCVHSRTGAAA